MINRWTKYRKWKRLIKKYTPDEENQVYLMRQMRDDYEFLKYYRHIIRCELRCLVRLKKLR
jgi:hypothetical protein